MRATLKKALSAIVLVLFSVSAVSAHHADFFGSQSTPVVLKGKIIQLELKNPHCFLLLEVQGSGGQVQKWNLEFGPFSQMRAQGWTNDSLKAGDQVTVTAFTDKASASAEKVGSASGSLKEVEFGGRKLQGRSAPR